MMSPKYKYRSCIPGKRNGLIITLKNASLIHISKVKTYCLLLRITPEINVNIIVSINPGSLRMSK